MIKQITYDKLKVEVFATRKEMGEKAVKDIEEGISALLAEKEVISIVFAAAPSQIEVLAGLRESTVIDWSRIVAFHMDEYIGLSSDARQLFGNFLKSQLFDHVPLNKIFYINSEVSDYVGECKRYSDLLMEYRPEITILGIGENGHIAFNDPSVADFADKQMVKIVKLDAVCRQQQVNDGCFSELNAVPTHALTLTVPALMNSDSHYCVVPDERKAGAVTGMLLGEVDNTCPASVLRFAERATLYLDKCSAAGIL